MMDEYIDRDAVTIPADNVSHLMHGRWIMRGGRFHCSICDAKSKWDCFGGTGGFSREYEQAKTLYCPNCGAKMDMEETDDGS